MRRSRSKGQPQAPDRLWIGDITYVATHEGWLYLAVLLDPHPRRVVGWAMADHLRSELAADALAMALQGRRPAPGLMHHTDRGWQYTAATYQACLAARGVTVSMSRAGECLDNAMAESFFATLKAEFADTRTWPTRAAARLAIFEWLEVWYNRQRRHSALGYHAPVAYGAQQLLSLQDPAAWRYPVRISGLTSSPRRPAAPATRARSIVQPPRTVCVSGDHPRSPCASYPSAAFSADPSR